MKHYRGTYRALPILLAFLAWLAVGARADFLSEVPKHWADLLQPVAETDISGAETSMQEAIAEARADVEAGLAQEDPDRRDLARAYGRLGTLFLLEEVEAQADTCLRNAMALDPDELRWPYYAGYMAMLAGNLDQALAYFEQARAVEPDYPTLHLRLGKVQLDQGDLKQARAAFERVVEVPELAGAAHYYLGQIALLERRFDNAARLLEAALEVNPEATEVHYPLARAYQALGEDAQARAHLERFKLRSPIIEDPLLDEIRAETQRSVPAFERAIYAVHNGDYATAADEFADGLAADPKNANARVSYARALYLLGRESEARAALQQALESNPDHALAHYFVGVLAQAGGDGASASARSAYRQALEREPDHAGALFALANLDFAEGRFAEAAAGYSATLGADDEVAPARLLGLVAALHSGAGEEEIAAQLEALRTAHPDDPGLRYAQARLLAAAEDPAVRDPESALASAVTLMTERPIPPHQRLLALSDASAGRFERAARAQQQLIDQVGWMVGPGEQALMQQELAAYRQGALPSPAWPIADPLLSPPPFDPNRAFKDYPASTPY